MSYPYGQPSYPGYGYPQPAYPAYPPRPSGAAAITAGLIATLIGLVAAAGAALTLMAAHAITLQVDGQPQAAQILAAVEGFVALLWLLSGISLMNHRNGGRITLTILAIIGLLGSGYAAVAGSALPRPDVAIGALIGVAIALLLVILANVRSTRLWCGAGRPYPYY